MKALTTLLLTLAITMTSSLFAADSVHDFKMESLGGKEVDLSQYKGKVLLIVNTASKCGLTPQYKQLQAMHKEFGDKGLVVLGFPCNQFGRQEPGSSSDISEFCTANYGVEFPMFAKIEVNGEGEAPLYSYLKGAAPLKNDDGEVSKENDIRWNFEKFVVGKDGTVVERFQPRTKPDAEEVVRVINEQLAQ